MAKLTDEEKQMARANMQEGARQRIAERGMLQFPADPETILAVYDAADRQRINVGTLLRLWVQEKLAEEVVIRMAPDPIARVENPNAAQPLVKKTTNELQIDCEVAAEILAEMLAFCAKELAEEADADTQNLEKIETLEKQILELKRDKLSIGLDNTEVINKALYFYAPLLKKRTRVC